MGNMFKQNPVDQTIGLYNHIVDCPHYNATLESEPFARCSKGLRARRSQREHSGSADSVRNRRSRLRRNLCRVRLVRRHAVT